VQVSHHAHLGVIEDVTGHMPGRTSDVMEQAPPSGASVASFRRAEHMSGCTLAVITAGVVDNRLRGKKLHGRNGAGDVSRAATKKRDDDTVDVQCSQT